VRYARYGVLAAAVLAAVGYVAATTWPWAVLFCVAVAAYVLLDNAPWRTRAPLLAGIALLAGYTLMVIGPTEDFGWFAYGPSTDLDQVLRQVAERSLMSTALTGLALLGACACLYAAVWTLPRRRNPVLAAVAGLIAVGFLIEVAPILSDVDIRLAVLLAALGLLTCLAVGAIASQRAAMAWLAIAGAALLAFQSLNLLEQAAINAAFADGADDGMPILGLAPMLREPGLSDDLLFAAAPAGLLLVVLGCCLRTGGHAKDLAA